MLPIHTVLDNSFSKEFSITGACLTFELRQSFVLRMSFVSWQYGFLLAAAFVLYWSVPGPWRIRLLLAASYIFYAAWDIRFISLLLASTSTYYFCGLAIANKPRPLREVFTYTCLPGIWLVLCLLLKKPVPVSGLVWAFALPVIMLVSHVLIQRMTERDSRCKAFLWLALGVNLGLLGFFKYFNFFAESGAALLNQLGLETDWTLLNIVLPVGISFYTFQAISYVVDIQKNKVQPTSDFTTFATYLAFFPQLVAGPIERSTGLLPQLLKPPCWIIDHLYSGARLLLIGFFKKIFVADNCAILANHVFSTPSAELNTAWALLGVSAFAFQIYGDFSGYSDIARGSARLLGIELTINFRLPYLALNPSEFWRRWHITLSTWFRDYVYIPLGGNKGTAWKTCRNLTLAMLLAGLWHGASWNFVLWGAYHALLLGIFHHSLLWQQTTTATWPRKVAAWLLMFALTLLGWAIFRAESFPQLFDWLQALSQWHNPDALDWRKPSRWLWLHIVPLLLFQAVTFNQDDESSLSHLHWATRGIILLLLFILTVTSMVSDKEFIYFRF